MFSSLLTVSFVAALVPQALAKLYITSPVATTTCQAGKSCGITWNDDGTQPTLSQIGPCDVGLYIGSQTTQIQLQDLGRINVNAQAVSNFTPNAAVGGDSPLYFLRFTSLNLSEGLYNYESFSAKFTLTGMTGTFNATEQALMTAPTSSVASTTTGASPTARNNTGITTTSATRTATTSKSTTTAPSNAAAPAFDSSSPAAALVAVVISAFFAAAAF